jgi:hypothetical protein
MNINKSGQSRPPSPHLAPLQHPPRRIRPPFDITNDDTAAEDQRNSETAHQWRTRSHADRVTALLEPLDGIELGHHDRRIIDWLADWDTTTIGTIASLLYRARAIGNGAEAETQDRAL